MEGVQSLSEARRHAHSAHPEDYDAVVRQNPVLDGLGERQQMQERTVDLLIAHVDDLDAFLIQAPLGARRVDARRGGHVEPLPRTQSLVIVELLEIDLAIALPFEERTRGAMSLVDDGVGSEHTTTHFSLRVVCLSHSRLACETSAMIGAVKRMRPPSGATCSAMRSEVKVLPVPHAMTKRLRSWLFRPSTTSSTAAA